MRIKDKGEREKVAAFVSTLKSNLTKYQSLCFLLQEMVMEHGKEETFLSIRVTGDLHLTRQRLERMLDVAENPELADVEEATCFFLSGIDSQLN